MTFFYTFTVVGICFLIFMQTYWIWTIKQDQKKRHVREEDPITMYDIREALIDGEKDAAIEMYCELFNMPPERAVKDIEELERSLST